MVQLLQFDFIYSRFLAYKLFTHTSSYNMVIRSVHDLGVCMIYMHSHAH